MNSKRVLTILTICLAAICALSAHKAFAQPGPGISSPSIDYYLLPSTGGSVTPDSDGFIRRWTLLEPIGKPNRSNTVFVDSYIREAFAQEYFPNQMTVVPKDGDKVKVTVEKQAPVDLSRGRPMQPQAPAAPIFEKQTLTWHALDSKLFHVKLFRFATGLDKERHGVIFWAVTVLYLDEDLENVRLAVGSNSASMWWLDGQEALILSGDRRMVMDDATSKRLTIKKGRHVLRGAVINGPGMSDFCVRIIDEDGKPVRNYTIANQ